MTDREKIMKKVRTMYTGLADRVFDRANSLLLSEAIDIESESEDSYALAKCVLAVAMEEVTANSIRPLLPEHRKDYENLKRF